MGVNAFIIRNSFCNNCGFVGQYPLVDTSAMEKVYSETYRNDSSPDPLYLIHHEMQCKKRYEYISKHIGFDKGMVLEIGSAAGVLLNEFKKNGFVCNGIEPTKSFAEFSVKHYLLDVKTGFFSSDSCRGKKYDLVLIVQTLEHIPEPLKILESVITILNDTGIVYVEVPNILAYDSFEWLSSPHVSSFNIYSLKYLARKAGLSIEFCETNPWGISMFCKKSDYSTSIIVDYSTKKLKRQIKRLFLKIKIWSSIKEILGWIRRVVKKMIPLKGRRS